MRGINNMTYDKDIPELAVKPAMEADAVDEFDPSPYDKLVRWSPADEAQEAAFKKKPADDEAIEEDAEGSVDEPELEEFASPELPDVLDEELAEETAEVYEPVPADVEEVAEQVAAEAEAEEPETEEYHSIYDDTAEAETEEAAPTDRKSVG